MRQQMLEKKLADIKAAHADYLSKMRGASLVRRQAWQLEDPEGMDRADDLVMGALLLFEQAVKAVLERD